MHQTLRCVVWGPRKGPKTERLYRLCLVPSRSSLVIFTLILNHTRHICKYYIWNTLVIIKPLWTVKKQHCYLEPKLCYSFMNMLNLCRKQHIAKANSLRVLLFKYIVTDNYLQIAMYIILGAKVNYVSLSSDIVAVVSIHWSSSHPVARERFFNRLFKRGVWPNLFQLGCGGAVSPRGSGAEPLRQTHFGNNRLKINWCPRLW